MKKKQNKYVTIKCTEKQAMLIEVALDTLSRMTCGQLHTIIDGMSVIKGKYIAVDSSKNLTLTRISNALQNLCNDNGKMCGYQLGSHVSNLIKPLLFPELESNSSYGVGHKEIGDAQIAYEIVKKLQNYRVRNRKNKQITVLNDPPLHYSNEPLIEITEV